MASFDSKHIIVTGGGGGIGSATVRRFAAAGGKVSVFDRDISPAEAIASSVSASGGEAQAFHCDITDRVQVDAAVASAVETFGPVAVLVNNAGWDIFCPFLKTTPDDWQRLININLVGALHMHHAVLPMMIEQNYGRIVNIASDAARVGSTGAAVYSACKAAVVALTKTLAREHSRHNVTLNAVCPGPTDTALFADFKNAAGNPEKLLEGFRRSIPLGRIGVPEDLPGAILFFASDDAAFVTGQVLSVSGGLTMAG